MRAGAPLELGQATIVFRGSEALPDEVETVRPMGAEQSNSSLVLDEQLVLKLYRRIEPGMNPELEVLRFLTDRGFEHIAALEGYVAYEGRPLEATLAILQRVRARARATAGSSRSTRSARDPDWLPAHARRLGEVTALLHNALGSDPTDPHFAPEEPSTESLALLSASIDEEIESVFSALPDIEALAPVARPRRGGARPAPRAHAHRPGRPGDPDARRLPPRPGALDGRGRLARPRLRGRAGALAARAAAEARRRCATSPGCSARSRTPRRRREIQRGVEAPEGWEERCRTRVPRRLLRRRSSRRCCPRGEQAIERLLTVFELEKAVYELRYELGQPARLGLDPGRRDPADAGGDA